MATWTPPRTWITNDLGNEALLNQQLRDNLLWLKTPPSVEVIATTDISTTSTILVSMTSMSGLLEVVGSRLLVGYSGPMRADADTRTLSMTVNVDGVALALPVVTEIGTNVRMVAYVARIRNVTPGIRLAAIYWQTGAGTMFQDGATTQRRFFAAEWL